MAYVCGIVVLATFPAALLIDHLCRIDAADIRGNQLARFYGPGIDFRSRVARIKARRARESRVAELAFVLLMIVCGVSIAGLMLAYAILRNGHLPY